MEGTLIPDMGKNESPAHKTSKDVAGQSWKRVCSAKCTGDIGWSSATTPSGFHSSSIN
jgi:hypothetical protein